MVAVVTGQVTRETGRIVRELGPLLTTVEFVCSWEAYKSSGLDAHAVTPRVWMVTHEPPSAQVTHTAALLGIAGWVWSDVVPIKGRVSPHLIYRLRFNADEYTTEAIVELGQSMAKYGAVLDPYWTHSAVIDTRELARYCDYPAGYLDNVVNAQPFKCQAPLVLGITGGTVRGCPFRYVPATRFEHTRGTLEHARQCLPCPTGCYFHHPVEAANIARPIFSGPTSVAESLRMAVLPRWTWWRISKLLPPPPRGIRGGTLPDWEVMQRVLYALVIPQRIVWDKELRKAQGGPNLEVTRYRWSHWVKTGAWEEVEAILKSDWTYAKFADWTRVPLRRAHNKEGSLLWGYENLKQRRRGNV